MKVVGIIPARYKSERFPGKPLADIAGKPMIQRVYEQAIKSRKLDKLYVATDHPLIYDTVTSFGGAVIMTSENCKNGTERCANLVTQLNQEYDVVINIQGDEPVLNPEQIDQLIDLITEEVDIATLAHHLQETERSNPNIVKLALGVSDFALGFSRDYSFIENLSNKIFKHIGLYGFKSSVLKKIVKLQPTPNELFEKLEQLRWLDHGFNIKVGLTKHGNYAVDIPSDIDKIITVLNQTQN